MRVASDVPHQALLRRLEQRSPLGGLEFWNVFLSVIMPLRDTFKARLGGISLVMYNDIMIWPDANTVYMDDGNAIKPSSPFLGSEESHPNATDASVKCFSSSAFKPNAVWIPFVAILIVTSAGPASSSALNAPSAQQAVWPSAQGSSSLRLPTRPPTHPPSPTSQPVTPDYPHARPDRISAWSSDCGVYQDSLWLVNSRPARSMRGGDSIGSSGADRRRCRASSPHPRPGRRVWGTLLSSSPSILRACWRGPPRGLPCSAGLRSSSPSPRADSAGEK